MAVYNLKCQWCNKDFSCTHKNQKYCSKECYNKSRKGKAPVFGTTKEIPCPQCHKVFKQRQANSKFCSRECQATWHGNEEARGKGYTRLVPCKECGKEFLRDSKSNVYCSLKCLGKAHTGEGNATYLSYDDLSEMAKEKGFEFISRGMKNERAYNIVYRCNLCGEVNKSNRIRFNCSYCTSSKGEFAVKEYCKSNNMDYEAQYTNKMCRYKHALAFDFAIYSKEELVALIEYQGEQHYKVVEYWGGEKGLKMRQKRDNIKRDYCKVNNIPLIEIPYTVEDIESFLEKELDKLNQAIQLSIL